MIEIKMTYYPEVRGAEQPISYALQISTKALAQSHVDMLGDKTYGMLATLRANSPELDEVLKAHGYMPK